MTDGTVWYERAIPTHPGAILREDVLPHLKLSTAKAAEQLGVSRQNLHRLLTEKQELSLDMAVRLGRFCGNGETLWLRLREARLLWKAFHRIKNQLQHIPTPALGVDCAAF